MAADRKTSSNALVRILGGVIGLGILAYGLFQLFGPVSLPACDSDEVRKAVRQMVAGSDAADAPAPALSDITESSYDEESEVRTCATSVAFDGSAPEKLSYRVAWQDKGDRQFVVNGLTVPRCDRTEVLEVLKGQIGAFEQTQQPARTLASVAQIEDQGLDTAEAIRSCQAVATFEGGAEQKVAYTIEWHDPEKTQFAVEAQYQP